MDLEGLENVSQPTLSAARCIGASIFAPGLIFLSANEALAQAIAPVLPANMVAAKGETKSNSINSGSRSSLSLSSTSNLGTSSSVSSQGGNYTASSSSNLAIGGGSFTSSFGKSGFVDVDIRNIRTEGIKSGSVAGNDYNVVPETGSTAQGQAIVKGMSSDLDIRLDPTTSAKAETGQIKFKVADNNGLVNEQTVPGSSNASSGHSMGSSMNVDISNTSFSQSFSQAF